MKLERVCKYFDEVKVLQDISLCINDKEITCILGPSGCGKSTLLNIMAGVLKPDAGRVTNPSQRVGYVFQEDRLLPWRTVYENIRLVNKKATDKGIMDLIEVVGLRGFEKKFPGQLSGGMRQRCSIARAFNFESQLLLMDEPFKSLDYDLRLTMVGSLIDMWSKWSNSVVFVTHEIDEAILLGNRIVVLSKDPCIIVEEIEISTPQLHRRLEDREASSVRSRLLKLLTKQKEAGAYKSA